MAMSDTSASRWVWKGDLCDGAGADGREAIVDSVAYKLG